MQLMPFEDIVNALQGEVVADVAKATGLHYNTIKLIKHRHKTNPTLAVLEKLTVYFKGR